jgi:biotin carboxyl carrier protein
MSKAENTDKTPRTDQVQRYVMRKVFTAVNANHITAFMPGTVGQILVKKGDKVRKGETIIILQCMKMDNELQAPFDARIKSINVKTGENVVKDSVLIELN